MKLTYTGIGEVDLQTLTIDCLLDRQALCMGIMNYLSQATKFRHYTQTELDLLTLVSNDYYCCGELLVQRWNELFILEEVRR